ncbi:restriction endonuclease subunit S [Mucilaginibacter lutimaris]|uniref:Restriction endonuclease subunit S n=1 Tax=Mucilaginibacter lutimaris TaxID=931629 RepID=A0ABW2ZHV8_9SPHI
MKSYNQYKSSGDSFVKSIPSHWRIDKLKRHCYLKGRIGWQGLKHSEFSEDKNLPYLITGMNFKNGIIQWDEVYHISEERYNEAPEIQLKIGDILMTKDGTIGKLLFVDTLPGKASLNSHLLVLRPLNNAYFPRFLYYQLLSEHFNNHIELYKSGTTFYGLSQEDTGKFKVLLPPLEEQFRISQYLDFKTKQLDKLIYEKEKLIELLKEERIATIHSAMTKGLNPHAPLVDSGIEWSGKIPDSWQIWKLSHAFKKIGSGTTPESGNPLYHENGTVNWLNTGDLNDGILTETSKKVTERALKDYAALKIFPARTVVIAMYGATIGKVSVVNCEITTNQACCVFYDSDVIINEFLFYWFIINKPQIINLSKGGGQPNISSEALKSLKVPCPNKDEQQQIIDFIKVEEERILNIANKVRNEIDYLKEYKTALISEVVTGKVDIRDEAITELLATA